MGRVSNKTEEVNMPGTSKYKAWLKKIGIAGFMFFFIKGLVWLAIIFGAGKCAMG